MKSQPQFDHDRYKFYSCKLFGLLKLFSDLFLARCQNSAFSSKWGRNSKKKFEFMESYWTCGGMLMTARLFLQKRDMSQFSKIDNRTICQLVRKL